MDMMPNGISNQSNMLNPASSRFITNNKMNSNNSAYYAKKGEPMYMKEMDADEDGVVSFDEFKEYCQSNGISTKEMVRMAEMASAYRVMKAEQKAEKAVQKEGNKNAPDIEEVNDGGIYAKRGDSKYDEVMDTNNDDKVTYKEYMEYCQEHAKSDETKSNSTDKDFETKSAEKAIETYTEGESDKPENFVDDVG